MFELINNLSPYAPFVIAIASFLDIFFATGLILYGAAMMGSIAMMYGTGIISFEAIVISSFLGTLSGNCLNYLAGRKFSKTRMIKKKLDHPKVKNFTEMLNNHGLLLFIAVSRFIAITRPLYAILIGSLHISFLRFFIYESIIAFAWVCFWLLIIIEGGQLFTAVFR